MKLSIFEYKDYKRFIRDWIDQSPQQGRGLRTKLAEALGCQTAFVTHVLSGEYHFSLEQAEACARWMGLEESELDFFFQLILLQRAGTKNLQKHFERQISQKREQQTLLKKRVNIPETLSNEDQQIYYSEWTYATLHMAVLIPELQTLEGLQSRFAIPPAKLRSTLDFLVNRGLIAFEKGRFKSLKPVLHLEVESPLIKLHHTNWRLRAIDTIDRKSFENLHYSGVISLSKEDYEWVREKLSQLLKQVVERLKNSPDEKLACLNFDWFEI